MTRTDSAAATPDLDDHDRGLHFDVGTLIARRRALKLLGGAGLLALVGCASSGSESSGTTDTAAASGASTTAGAGSATGVIPEETAGPYPGDGSNGPDALSATGIVRSDITSSFGEAAGVAAGVPFGIVLVVQDAATGKAKEGAAVYAWHADQEGRYSMYSQGVEDQNYLRGVQPTDADGAATFASIHPGCYDGRWPHIHFEVYESVDAATGGGEPIATSQIALPEATCAEVYATNGYESSASNLTRVSLASDMVFADSYEQELGTISGTVAKDLTVTLVVPI